MTARWPLVVLLSLVMILTVACAGITLNKKNKTKYVYVKKVN